MQRLQGGFPRRRRSHHASPRGCLWWSRRRPGTHESQSDCAEAIVLTRRGGGHRAGPTEAFPAIPDDIRIAWISTRRGASAADGILANVLGRYLLHDVVSQLTAPFHELSHAHVAVLEVPPSVAPLYEHKLLDTITRIRAAGPEVAVIVQPSMRWRTDKSFWIHKWNQLRNALFKFFRTCSCQTGNSVKGCHFALYVGASWQLLLGPCVELPTLSSTSAASLLSLSGTLTAIALKCPSRDVVALRAQPARYYQAPVADCHPSTSGSAGLRPLLPGSGSTQTPDSAVPVPPDRGRHATARDRTEPTTIAGTGRQTYYPTDRHIIRQDDRRKSPRTGTTQPVEGAGEGAHSQEAKEDHGRSLRRLW